MITNRVLCTPALLLAMSAAGPAHATPSFDPSEQRNQSCGQSAILFDGSCRDLQWFEDLFGTDDTSVLSATTGADSAQDDVLLVAEEGTGFVRTTMWRVQEKENGAQHGLLDPKSPAAENASEQALDRTVKVGSYIADAMVVVSVRGTSEGLETLSTTYSSYWSIADGWTWIEDYTIQLLDEGSGGVTTTYSNFCTVAYALQDICENGNGDWLDESDCATIEYDVGQCEAGAIPQPFVLQGPIPVGDVDPCLPEVAEAVKTDAAAACMRSKNASASVVAVGSALATGFVSIFVDSDDVISNANGAYTATHDTLTMPADFACENVGTQAKNTHLAHWGCLSTKAGCNSQSEIVRTCLDDPTCMCTYTCVWNDTLNSCNCSNEIDRMCSTDTPGGPDDCMPVFVTEDSTDDC